MSAARATLTREDSEWSRKFEEPWQSRPRDWRGVGQFFLQGRVKGLPSPFNAAGWRCSYRANNSDVLQPLVPILKSAGGA